MIQILLVTTLYVNSSNRRSTLGAPTFARGGSVPDCCFAHSRTSPSRFAHRHDEEGSADIELANHAAVLGEAEHDQMLLILRVDRQMEWRDLALVISTSDASPTATLDNAALDREAGRSRKRFERVKAELKDLAKKAGLLP
jgi:hypothetical protein